MKNQFVLILAMLILFSACGNDKKNTGFEFTNDLENIKGWSGNDNNAKSVVKGIARSGNYVSQTDSINRFGYIFKTNISDVSSRALKTVKTSVWASVPVINNEALFVITIDSLGKTISWKGQKINEFVKTPNQWTEVIASEDISKLKPSKDYVISIYVWNTGSTEIFTDDHRVKFFE